MLRGGPYPWQSAVVGSHDKMVPSEREPGGGRPGASSAPSTLEGILERVTYVNEENAWSVVRLAVPGKKDLVTVVGNLLGVQPRENLRLRGCGLHLARAKCSLA